MQGLLFFVASFFSLPKFVFNFPEIDHYGPWLTLFLNTDTTDRLWNNGLWAR